MVVYAYVPYARLIFYLFTILFHAFLLIRALIESRYLLVLVLLIPVTAVSAALWRFTSKAATQIRMNESTVEILTLFGRYTYTIDKIRLNGRSIEAPDRKFVINPNKAETIKKRMSIPQEW